MRFALLGLLAACCLASAHVRADTVDVGVESDVNLESDMIAEDTLEVHNPMEVGA
jgi:hypothetical protein